MMVLLSLDNHPYRSQPALHPVRDRRRCSCGTTEDRL
jgi:hypothetical protein